MTNWSGGGAYAPSSAKRASHARISTPRVQKYRKHHRIHTKIGAGTRALKRHRRDEATIPPIGSKVKIYGALLLIHRDADENRSGPSGTVYREGYGVASCPTFTEKTRAPVHFLVHLPRLRLDREYLASSTASQQKHLSAPKFQETRVLSTAVLPSAEFCLPR